MGIQMGRFLLYAIVDIASVGCIAVYAGWVLAANFGYVGRPPQWLWVCAMLFMGLDLVLRVIRLRRG